MSSFELLSKQIQRKIWDMRWDSFTPIQDKTIPVIMETQNDVIISSGTASGKTEAAFLPIISMIEAEADTALKVLYVSPLKALINNQFERIEKLCEHTNIPIHRWHGDINQSQKRKFLKKPTGILQITPESIESIFINRTEQVKYIFKELDFIVIDEIHSFLDTERGVQLRSLLSRLEEYTLKYPRIIGLSATIDNFELVKRWVNIQNVDNVKIIESKGSDKELLYNLMHFPIVKNKKKPVELFEDMRDLTKHQKAIIFCNSRGDVEESTVFLNRLAEREHIGETYYAHHSSIDKKEREYVEKTIIESKFPKSVVATSSLELGIDIGDVDIVVQLDNTYTVSSLKQRLGRSGRKKGSNQMLQLYTTNKDSLVQSLAVMELILEKWIEPARGYALPLDIVFHQIISICQETNGIMYSELLERLEGSHIFYTINTLDVQNLINYMVEKDHLEVIKGKNELIVGLEGERILRSREFYSVFMTQEEYEVLEGIKKIGRLDKQSFINAGDNIILAGKLWTIHDVDSEKNKVYVSKAFNGKAPRYMGSGGDIHKEIGEKMMRILCSNKEFSYINESAVNTLRDARKNYQHFYIEPQQRVIWQMKTEMIFETYTGTIIAQTLLWMLRSFGINAKSMDGLGRINIVGTYDILSILNQIKNKTWSGKELIIHVLEQELFISKYSIYLPSDLQERMHIAHKMNIQETLTYLNQFQFSVIKVD